MKGHYQKIVNKRGDTTWHVVLDMPPDPGTGKRRQKRLTAPTKKELEAKVATMLHHMQQGSWIEPSALTVAEFMSRCLESAASTVRSSTLGRYKQVVRDHIVKDLGAAKLSGLSPIDVQTWIAKKRDANYGAATIRVAACVLSRAFAQAVKWRLLPHNPCDGMELPRVVVPEVETWSAEQSRHFLNVTKNHDHHVLWVTALATGARLGELLALRWTDVDLTKGVVAIRRTLTRTAEGGMTFGPPKSKSGQRQIVLPSSCVAVLHAHRLKQIERRLGMGPEWEDGDLVFDNGPGGALKLSAVNERFQYAAKKRGLPRLKFHGLRHTAATIMLSEGIHPRVAQERLGHASVAMTLGRYSHVTETMQRDVADKLDVLFGS